MMILVHFTAGMFLSAPHIWGSLAYILSSSSLIWAGLLFMHASIPYRKDPSSRWMFASLAATNTLYIVISCFAPDGHWSLTLAAILLGLAPLVVMLRSIRRVNHPLRWLVAVLYGSLSIFLLAFQNRPGNGPDLAWNALMFTVYLGCCIFVFYAYRRATAGAFVTIAGFFFWASVFVVAPMMGAFRPQMHIESEVWNLPKFVVALGMMLLLLEDQIEHNKYLALHDALTGLPNRRLFQDRLDNALERSRRTGAGMALLVIDLDGFKQVNDTLGHHVGDMVLQRVASLFSERVRRSDTVSRTGGDEFSVILEEPTNREEAANVGRSLRRLLNDPLYLGDYVARIDASIGIAVFPEDASDAESLCIAADLRMYDAKQYSQRSNQGAASAIRISIPTRESAIGEQLGQTE
jgi:diguanylate cyclase (GGDEF)-like protein